MRTYTLARIVGLLLCAGILPPAAARAERAEPPPLRLTREELLTRAHAVPERAAIGPQGRGTTSPTSLLWSALGPRPIADDYWAGNDKASGRVSSIVVDPRNANVVYAAAAQGGVWKSTDAGTSWAPLGDDLSSLASGALAFDPTNPDILFYATGEQHEAGDSYAGDGLFKSIDAGASWAKIATKASVGDYVARVAVNATNRNILYIAGSRGLIRSVDGGVNWAVTQSGNWGYDLALHPTNSSILYGAIYGRGVYKSTDAGATWALLGGGLPAVGTFQRVQIALAASNPLVIYASFVTPSGTLQGMYRTSDGGTSWSRLSATPDYLNGQGWYDNCLTVDPGNANVCYAGGVFPYNANYHGIIRTTNGGTSWTDITIATDGSQVHPDQHIFAWGPDGLLWLGNDGGIWKTKNPGNAWVNCNDGLGITQFYTLGLHPSDPDQILGGTQDNGSVRYEGTESWLSVAAGDGGPVTYQWDSPNFYYTTYVFLDPLYKFDSGTFLNEVTGGWSNLDRADWGNGALVSDPNAANALLVGTYRVWRSGDGGDNWAPISNDLTNGGVLLSIGVSNGVPGTYYAASSDGRVSYTNDGGANWVPRSAGLPGFAIHEIVVAPGAPLTAYLCSANSFGAQVWKTTNGGVVWNNVSGDLPGVLGLSLAVDFGAAPPRLYLGTDAGVYSSANDGAHWTKESAGFPNTLVFDLGFDAVNGYVVAATHGRGMFRASMPNVGVLGTAPRVAWLRPASPNPGHAPFALEFQLARPAEIALEVYDLAGRKVRELASGHREPGRYHATWDGRDVAGRASGDGIYFYRLRAGAVIESRRLVLLH